MKSVLKKLKIMSLLVALLGSYHYLSASSSLSDEGGDLLDKVPRKVWKVNDRSNGNKESRAETFNSHRSGKPVFAGPCVPNGYIKNVEEIEVFGCIKALKGELYQYNEDGPDTLIGEITFGDVDCDGEFDDSGHLKAEDGTFYYLTPA